MPRALHLPRARLRAAFLGVALAAGLAAPSVARAIEVEHVRTTLTEWDGNGDGLVGPGETFKLTQRIRHADLMHTALTGVSGLLSESTSALSMFSSVAGYSDMSFRGAESQNVQAFTGHVSSAAPCGEGYDLQLSVSSAQGTGTVPVRISTGGPGPAESYDSTDVPKSLPDLSVTESTLEVGAAGPVKDVVVRLGDLEHTATGDLRVELVAPDGTKVRLVEGEDPSGNGFSNTVFSDAATASISGESAPFTGTFRPESPLSALAGRAAAGTWKLRVTDSLGSDSGRLDRWGIDVSTAVCNGNPVASFTATPNPALPDETVTLDASASSDPNGSIVAYEWDLDGDGEYDDGTGQTLQTSYAQRDLYRVGLRVTDELGGTGTRVVNVSVTQPPVAALAPPGSPLSGEKTTLDASGSADPDNAPLTRFEWDLDGDGEFEVDGGTSPTTDAQWASPGTKSVGVRVTDEDGATDVATAQVVVRNRPPTSAFTHPAPALAGTPATLNAGGSGDVDGSLVRYEWDLDGDGTFERDAGASPSIQHSFAQARDYEVTLRVTDDGGDTHTTTHTVRVTIAPTASFQATPNPVSLGRPVAFDASASGDADGQIMRYEWDLDGDGSFETDTGASPSAGRSYADARSYAVKLRVTDDDGAKATGTVELVAANVAPVAALVATPSPATAGQPVLLDARGSHDPDGTIVKYEWDLDGNGSFEATTGATATRSHSYPNAGSFTVGVRVVDNHGGARTAKAALSVTTPAGAAGPTGGGATPGPSGGGATPAPGAPGAGSSPFAPTLTGSPLQRIAGVLRRGLVVGCRADRAATCVVRAQLRASDARRLGMRARRRPVVLGRARVVLQASGARSVRLRLTPAGRRALRRGRRVSLVVRGTATAVDGGRRTVSRSFLLRR